MQANPVYAPPPPAKPPSPSGSSSGGDGCGVWPGPPSRRKGLEQLALTSAGTDLTRRRIEPSDLDDEADDVETGPRGCGAGVCGGRVAPAGHARRPLPPTGVFVSGDDSLLVPTPAPYEKPGFRPEEEESVVSKRADVAVWVLVVLGCLLCCLGLGLGLGLGLRAARSSLVPSPGAALPAPPPLPLQLVAPPPGAAAGVPQAPP